MAKIQRLGMLFFPTVLLPLLALISCGKEKPGESGGEMQESVEITFLLKSSEKPSLTWTGLDKVRILQITDGKVTQSSDCFINTSANGGATVRLDLKVDRNRKSSYTAIFPASILSGENELSFPSSHMTGTDGVFTSACDIMAGVSEVLQPSQTQVELEMKRLGSILDINVQGLPKGQSVKNVKIRFPGAAAGKITIDPVSGQIKDLSRVEETTLSLTVPGIKVQGDERFSCRYIKTWDEEKPSVSVLFETDKGCFVADGAIKGDRVDVTAEEAFKNPVTSYNWPDPTIWYDESAGCLFTAATSVTDIKKSTDGVNWTSTRRSPLTTDAKELATSLGKHQWAPDVVRVGNSLIMYLTSINEGTDSRIAAYLYNPAKGQFEYLTTVTDGKTTGIADTIDAEVVIDPQTGKRWLFFGSIGKMHRVELTEDATSVAPGAKYEHVAGLTSSQDGTRAKVFEGAYVHQHGDYWYLFASAGKYADHSYNIVVGRSKTIDGQFLTKDGKDMTTGAGTIILSSKQGDEMFGPGHNGEIFTDKTGQDYIYYHCHDNSLPPSSNRYMFLQRIYWDEKDGWPYFETGKPLRYDRKPVL